MKQLIEARRTRRRRRGPTSFPLVGSATDRRRLPKVAGALVALVTLSLVAAPPVSAQGAPPAGFDQSAPVGLTLEADRQSLTSALRVDLTFEYATLPLYRGKAAGETVWYVITDVSDAGVASELGVNHAPKLANVPTMCPACSQETTSSDPVLGRAPVEFQGAPDFSPQRTLIPGPGATPFPAQSSAPGAQGRDDYSPFVTVGSSSIVYNAPIVATGDGPFDVTTHADTHDRTLGIDTVGMTADMLYVRGFSNGEPILYLSFESSDAFTAMIERSTFVPALADLGFANGGGRADSARASIFTFANAKVGLEAPSPRGASDGPGRNQGLTHALSFPVASRDAAIANPDVIEGLRNGGDVSNIFDVFPTNARESDRNEYSPAWDLQVGVYSEEAVAAGLNGLKTDANEVRRLARRGVVSAPGGLSHTAPGGAPTASANLIINCPALAFLEERPVGPRLPTPGRPPMTPGRAGSSFTDVTAADPHGAEIAGIADAGVAIGLPDGTFRPGQPVTRGQMASFLVRALDLPAGAASFNDVPSTHAHAASIAAVAAAGVATGFPDGGFGPDQPVTRGQMASFLLRALELDVVVSQPPFPDVGLEHPHVQGVAALQRVGIADGFPDGTFRPDQDVTRAQMASFLARAFVL